MKFSAHRLDSVEPSPTLAITARAKELRSQGKDVIGFGAGEPDFDTPDHIKQAAIRALDAGQTKYTPVGGTPGLKKAVIQKFQRDNQLDFSPGEIIVSVGGKQVLYNLFLATLNPGDEVIIPAPYWVSYADITRLAEATPVIVKAGIDQGYIAGIDQIRAAITDRTRMILVNSPSNPTGGVYPDKELQELAELLKERDDILLVTDDIYEHILFDGRKFLNVPMLVPELKDRWFIVNGVSKAYSMTGWRIGYGAGPQHIIKNMETIQGQSTSGACSIAQAAAQAALSESQDCVGEMREAFQQRRDLVTRMLSSIPGVRTFSPGGAFYSFPDLSEIYQRSKFQALMKDRNDSSPSRVFCAHLLDHYEVAAVPGIAFGDDAGIRISYALSEENIRTGIERLGNMIHDLD
ncbi:MAG: pyridoxal phosphate-dependent aminotransferase [Leptospiraceae bacterium]|nr:pyridoxal phosphate-dependent aminotransferase [Leptospiraceae bacterium]